MSSTYVKSWVEINKAAVAQNAAAFRIRNPDARLCAVVKADAYGHGIEMIVPTLVESGIDLFGVDHVSEALRVRALAPEATVIIFGVTFPEELEDAVGQGITVTVYDDAQVRAIGEVARKLGKLARVNIKVETGLHRQGADSRMLNAMVGELRRLVGLVVVQGVSTHFAASEANTGKERTLQQDAVFCDAISWLQGQGIVPEIQHASCSASAIMYPDLIHNAYRPGIGLYGLWSSADVKRFASYLTPRFELQPVLTWRARLASVKDISPGDGVGYGPAFVANRPMRIAVVPVGYYDGYHRAYAAGGSVLVKGIRCPILGNICMDMFMIDVSNVPNAKAGDAATLIGRDGMLAVTADEIADRAGTIHYEVVTSIREHLPRLSV